MSDSLPLGLAQQEKARSVDPDLLEQFGKKAAALYQGKGTPLTAAVVEVVKEASLSPEQVRRVCEFANTTAYLSEFEKAGSVRNVTFEGGPANPARVLQDLNDGSSPAGAPEPMEDYKKASADFRRGQEMDVLAQAFSFSPAAAMSKTAAAQTGGHQGHADPMNDLLDTRDALGRMRDNFTTMKTSAQLVFEDVSAELAKVAEQEFLEGTSLSEMAQAFTGTGATQAQVKEAMQEVWEHLNSRGHKVPAELHLSKTASALPNLEHPLLVRYAAFTKAAHALRVVDRALNDVQEQLGTINKAISGAVS